MPARVGTGTGRSVARRSRPWIRWAAAFALLTACSADELFDASGRLEVGPALEFGEVALGRRKVDKVVLRNLGRGPLTVRNTTLDRPAARDFTLGPQLPIELGPGETVELGVAFAPDAEGRRAVRLRLETDSLRTPEAVVELWGDGVLGRADPGSNGLDFGRVAVQTDRSLTVDIANPSTHLAEVNVGASFGDDAAFFTATPSGDVTIGAGQTARISVRFAPMRLGPHLATLPIQPCPTCAVTSVALAGEGIAATLVASPPGLDYGFTEPLKTNLKGTTIANVGTATVTILEVRLGGDTPDEYALAPLNRTLPFDLPSNATFDAGVGFTPRGYDKRGGTLRIRYADPSWANPQELVVPLGGAGGGPDIDVNPDPLAYPRTAVGLNVEKKLSIRNVGRDPTKPLIITKLEIQGSVEFTLPALPPLPAQLAPGAQMGLGVAYGPLVGGQSQGQLVIESNDPDENPRLVKLHGSASELGPCRYEVVPQRLDFGAVPIGSRARLAFAIRNTGNEICAAANVRLAPQSDPAFAITQLSSRMIDPGQTLLVPVEYAPDSDASATGRVDFDVSSPTAPHESVLLTARGLAPCLQVDPDHLDFGAVGLACQPPTRPVAVRNACAVPVSIAGCEVGTAATNAFSLDPNAAGARTLRPGDELLLPVTYAPTTVGDDMAPLFVSADLSPAPLLVPLSGHAQLRPLVTDRYDLPPLNQVDFLFVVDNSGSFTEEQDALARNFDAFIRTAIANGTDYHIAVTTTGLTPYRGGWADCPGGVFGGESGRFFPVDAAAPRILTPQTPNVRRVFEQNVKVGICHWWEEGLEASRRALTPPLIDHTDDPATPDPDDGNLGFLRPEASLYVLYISDEDDSGTVDPDDYVRFLLGLKPGRPDRVNASAIVGLPSCPTAPSVGTRYMRVVNALGGVVADVCAPDWNGILDRIGQDAFAPQTTFPLQHAPDGRDLVVRVNGVDVPEVAADGSRNWHYDPSIGDHGAVVFEPARAPGPNSTVDLQYPVPCPPAH